MFEYSFCLVKAVKKGNKLKSSSTSIVVMMMVVVVGGGGDFHFDVDVRWDVVKFSLVIVRPAISPAS